jgi:hypothetical protein
LRTTLQHEYLYDMGIASRDTLLQAFDDAMERRRPFHVNLLYAVQLQSWLSHYF